MREYKFTLNALLLVVLIFSAIFFFFTVKLTSLADRSAYNDFYPIEGTPYAVYYSSLKPTGIYEGGKTTGVLRLEGQYGYDWGAAAVGDALFLNEYRSSELGLTLSHVVRIDTPSFDKQVLLPDAILRGRCASGELVCLTARCCRPTIRRPTLSAGSTRPGPGFAPRRTAPRCCSLIRTAARSSTASGMTTRSTATSRRAFSRGRCRR